MAGLNLMWSQYQRELDFGFKDFKCLNLDDYNNRAIFEETKMKAII